MIRKWQNWFENALIFWYRSFWICLKLYIPHVIRKKWRFRVISQLIFPLKIWSREKSKPRLFEKAWKPESWFKNFLTFFIRVICYLVNHCCYKDFLPSFLGTPCILKFMILINLPFDNSSVNVWKHRLSAFWHFFSSYSKPLQPYFSEQTLLLEVTHDPRHSLHSDQVA